MEEAEARKKHAEERRKHSLQQAAEFREHRIETRWPYMSSCSKVYKVTKPCFTAHAVTDTIPWLAIILALASLHAANEQVQATEGS